MRKVKNILDRKFGKIFVLSFKNIKRGHKYYTCRCDCGKVYDVRGSHLISGDTKACKMCAQIDDLTNKTFGFLTVTGFSHTCSGNAYWNCVCVCKNNKTVSGFNLKKGDVKSCGCKSIELSNNTCLDRYGTTAPTSNEDIKNKIRATNMNRYGVQCTLQNPNVMKKSKATLMEKYGVDHPMKSREIALKAARNANNSKSLKHWFSNEDIICVGSYEYGVVSYFNHNKVDYNWQPEVFLMPDGRTYTPDCYLPDDDKWIEIKGYFWEDAREKWDWFCSEYFNSELWDKNKLIKMGIL